MNVLHCLLLALFSLSLSSYANAVTPPEESVTKDWYQIEFALFEHTEGARSELRYEAHQYSAHQTTDYQYYFEQPYYRSGYPLLERHLGPVAQNDSILHRPVQRLVRDPRTDVLLQAYWQQPIDKESATLPLKITKTISDERVLEGYIRVRRERFMHIEIDVFVFRPRYVPTVDWVDWLKAPMAAPLASLLIPNESPSQKVLNKNGNANTSSTSEAGLFSVQEQPLDNRMLKRVKESAMVPMNVMRFQDSRRVKEGELHYLDHPALGLITSINKVELASTEAF